jgi:hypothetical protein
MSPKYTRSPLRRINKRRSGNMRKQIGSGLSGLATACLLIMLIVPTIPSWASGKSQRLETPSSPGQSLNLHQPLGQEPRDYFLPGELPPEAGSVRTLDAHGSSAIDSAAVAGGFPVKSTITYRSFMSGIYTLRAYSGKYVMWALPDSAIGGASGLSENEIRQLVSLSDLVYAHLTNLIGGEPLGDCCLLTIALVDTPGAGGLGKVGTKGVEVDTGQLGLIKIHLARELLAGVIPHEMIHNFDIYSFPKSYLDYYGDWNHAWTAFVQRYMQTYDRSGFYDLTPETALSLNTNLFVGPWDAAGAAATWAACVRDGGGCEHLGIKANEAWAGFLMRFGKLHGPVVMKKTFDYLKNQKAQNQPEPPTPEDKNDLLIKAMAFGANANISCEVDTWNWTVSPGARASIAQLYPAQNAFCADSDADGYSRAEGDFNDSNGAINPGAVETQNGLDDNCNDLVDDLLVAEPGAGDFPNPQNVGFPGRITGRTSSSSDIDSFTFNLPSPRKFIFTFCSTLDFDGFILMYKPGGTLFDFQAVSPGQCLTQTMDFDQAGQYRFDIQPNAHFGDYSVRYQDLKPWPKPWGTTAPPTLQSGKYKLTSTTQTLAGAFKYPTHVKFWVEGFGFVGTVPYAATAFFNWTPPPGTLSGTYGYRAQLFSGLIPVEAATVTRWFSVTIPPTLTSLTLTPASVAGGNTVVGKVTLSGPAPAGGMIVTLANTNPAATVPASVPVFAGNTSRTFTISTSVVTVVRSGYVTAKLGTVSKSVALKVRPIGVKSLTLTPNPVTGPNTVTGTVTLERAAAPGSITVTLVSSKPLVAKPTVATITIPAGITKKTFTISTANVTTSSTAIIKATANALSRSVTLTVN